MRDLHSCPSTLAYGFDTYSPIALKRLFSGYKISHIIDIEIDRMRNREEIRQAMNRISVSGVQEKFPASIYNGVIRLSEDNDVSTHILKPAPWDETLMSRKQIPANENLTMQIASQVYGIKTAENGLCFTPSGNMIYITKRFDINLDGTKNHVEDFASILEKTGEENGPNYKYEGTYYDIAKAIRNYIPTWMVAMEAFFKLLVFNYIYGNGDAHLKNFSVTLQGDDYVLAPAYDLLNTRIHINGPDLALEGGLSYDIPKSEVYEHTGHPCRKDFENFAKNVGLKEKRYKAILEHFMAIPSKTKELIANSYLNEKNKRCYIRILETNIARFIRE